MRIPTANIVQTEASPTTRLTPGAQRQSRPPRILEQD